MPIKIISTAIAVFLIGLCNLPASAAADDGRLYSAEELIRILSDKAAARQETAKPPDAEFTRGLGGVREGAADPGPSSPGSGAHDSTTASLLNESTPAPSRGVATQQFTDLFAADSYNLKATSYRQLDEIGRALHAIIANDPSATFTIEGYTDNTGSEQHDVFFSRQMAVAVKNYLVGKLMLDERRIAVIGYGSQRPVAASDSQSGRPANKRIELVGK